MRIDPKTRHNLWKFFAATAALIFATPEVFIAQPAAASPKQEQVSVVGHLALEGIQVKNIFLQQRGDKTYLFLRRVDKNAFAIVDVSDPAKPAVIDRNALAERKGSSVDLPAYGSGLAIAFVPDVDSGSSVAPATNQVASPPTESIRLIDLTDPEHPKVLRTFKRVASVATDEGRKLIFVLNDEGLWIVRHHRVYPLPMCTSESETEPEAQCQ